MAITLVSIILLASIVLLVSEKLPVDLTAIGIMVALTVAGILTPRECIEGFANPAPITIGLLFVVSQGLVRTGALDVLTERLVDISRGRPRVLLALSLLLVGGMSSFLNNTPVVVLFMSIIMAVCCKYNLSPSKFLIPISFVSILAGTSTLIGTSTNIIVSDLAASSGAGPIGMFELSILGIPMALAGAAYLFFFSFRLLRAHKEPVCELREHQSHYITELLIPEGSPLVGREAGKELSSRFPEVELFEVLRGDTVLDLQQVPIRLEAGDVLLVKAAASDLAQVLDQGCAALPKGPDGTIAKPYDPEAMIVELIVAPNTAAVGRSLDNVISEMDAHIHFLGLKRHGGHFIPEQAFRSVRLAIGDILLVQAPLDHLDLLRAGGEFLVLDDVVRRIVKRRKAPLAMGVFVAMVLATALGLADILTASLSAAFLLLITRCLSLREAYRSIDGRVLMLIIGTLALGSALSKSGAADLYADGFLSLFADAGPWAVLSGFILLTSVLSLFLSNNSTAVLLVPIALAAAATLGVSPRPFIVGICFGASACYASPIGYQTNLLVYGPGGYRFMDYLRLGLPLNIGVWLLASLFVPMLWPF